MYKFKTSKYKNALPKVPKRENWILDISVGSPQSHGNHIKASAAYVAFNCDSRGGGSLGVLSLDASGRIKKDAPMVHCHAEQVTDFDFSPFDDGLLATGSQDCSIKLWKIPESGLDNSLSNPEASLPTQNRRVENVLFHPTADGLLTTSSYASATLWDIASQERIWEFNDHENQVLSVSWKEDGRLLATAAKDKVLRILDPRSNSCVQETAFHQNPKDGRVLWLGNGDRILTSGFDPSHQRQICLRDVRNFEQPLKTLSPDTSTGILIPLYDVDTNMLFLAGKADSSVLFLEPSDSDPFLVEASRHICDQPVKGACLVPKRALDVMQCEVNRLLQLTSNAIIPVTYQVPRKTFRDFHEDLFPDTKGALPDITAQDWFQGADSSALKVSLDPKKNQNRPLTRFCPGDGGGGFSGADEPNPRVKETPVTQEEEVFTPKLSINKQSIAERKNSFNGQQQHHQYHHHSEERRMSSDPQNAPGTAGGPVPAPRRRTTSIDMQHLNLSRSTSVDSSGSSPPVAAPRAAARKTSREESGVGGFGPDSDSSGGGGSGGDAGGRMNNGNSCPAPTHPGSPGPTRSSTKPSAAANNQTPPAAATNNNNGGGSAKTPKTPKAFPGFRTSKFRHLHGAPLHRSTHIENVRNLSTSIPGECDGFQVNVERVAVPLRGPGGKIAIFELSKPGRLPDGLVPVVQCGTTVTDFAWDPFCNGRFTVACDDAKIRIFRIPPGGLVESITEPEAVLSGHSEKIYFIKFNPVARDILASGSYDMSVRIWDLSTCEEKLRLDGHTDQIFNLSWSLDGRQLATVCRDNRLRVYEPRKSLGPVKEGVGPVGNRGARVLWALDGKYLVVTGFDKVSERQVSVYRIDALNEPLTTIGIDVSPAILIPFYDADSSTLFVTGKGDATIFAYEVCSDPPYLFPLSHHKCPGSHQALAFLPKCICNVKDVEFARAVRLTPNTIEPLSFTVPRVKTEFFQDDLFPDTRVLWEATMTSAEWLSGKDKLTRLLSLQPNDMKPLSGSMAKPPPKSNDNMETNKISTPAPVFSRKGKADLNTLFATMAIGDGDLPQDSMEGVDSKEWDD